MSFNRFSTAAVLVMGVCLLFAQSASAAPDFLLQIPEDEPGPNPGAGRFNGPTAVVANPSNGHIYVSEFANARISEFTAWGVFVKAWGWDVAPNGAPGDTPSDELEVCTAVCKQGAPGNGAGQLNGSRGITLDGAGNVYVHGRAGSLQRVQKFDPGGNFLLMFGGEVNKTTGENICTKADLEGGEVCGAGVEGTTDGWFSGQSTDTVISYNPVADSIFVGDKDRIQEFGLDGSFEAKFSLSEPGTVGSLAADPSSGDLYFTYLIPDFSIVGGLAPQPDVHRVDPGTGAEIGSPLPAAIPREGLAVDVDGNVYAYDDDAPGNEDEPGNHTPRVLKFDAVGKLVEVAKEWASNPSLGFAGLGTNVLGPGSSEPGDLYVVYLGSYLEAYGPSPILFEDPPPRAPVISAQYGVSAGTNEATVRAQINPRFWDDATFYVEYGTVPCSGGGCDKEQPIPPGARLSAKSVNKALTTPGILLDGLEPATTYHFRFVSQSGGGGPVYGVDPDGVGPEEPTFEKGLEGSLRTFAMPGSSDSCPANEDVRIGLSAKLPDCRAYELVSPLDKNGGDATLLGAGNDEELNQSVPAGDRFTYSARGAFAGAESAPYTSQYIANRDPDAGWGSGAISPPRTRLAVSLISAPVNDFQAFSEDLCDGWLIHNFRPTLAEEAITGYPNLYRRENCAGTAYEAITRAEPPLGPPLDRPVDKFLPLVLGFSADGSHTVFKANAKLTTQGAILPDFEEPQLYEQVAGELYPRLVCILPSGNPSSQPCGLGGPAGSLSGKQSNVQGAVSDDGQRIFWTSFDPGSFAFFEGEPGRIFVRVEGKTTKAVSQSVTAENSWFWGASEDGSKAVFEVLEGPLADELYEFDVDAAIAGDPEPQALVAGEVEGVMGISEDASRIYFASREDLDAGGPATAGDVNLYLREGGVFTFIGALGPVDLSGGLGPANKVATQRGARITPDGRFAAFVSTASPTGYDNTDAVTGKPDMEVFLYDSVQEDLRCVSCNPTGIRPTGKAGVAASIPGWKRSTYAARIFSDEGQRLFFESHEALVPGDTNAKLDVYQWEAAGKGTCGQSDPTFSEASGGCVELISSGQSPADSRFLDASLSGNDVFIGSLSSLVPWDHDLFDVYDARVGGGFPPPVDLPICEGQACQSPPSPPSFPTPPSSQAGPSESKPRPCPKGKRRVVRKGKARCVPRKARKGKKQRKHSSKRRASR